ncbi:MAG: MarC family protein [Thermoproteota archaeon]|nr:MarC family protein [Thermoproteota archaeon]
MAGIIEFVLLSVTSVVAVMEPPSTIAIYITLTKDMGVEERRRVIAKSMKISFLVLLFFALAGQLFFTVFNITIAAFRIAGGLLLVSVAFRMLNPRKGQYAEEELEDVAVVPLAFPLTSGPGTITTVMLLVSEADGWLQVCLVFVGIFVGIALSYAGMLYASRISGFLGDEGLRVVTRLMSVIVLAIAVQFVIHGIADAIPQIIGVT